MTQFLTFAVIGVINTILDFVLWKFISSKISQKLDLTLKKIHFDKYSFSHLLAALIVFNFSYYMNRTFTFATKYDYSNGFLRFFLVSLFLMILSAQCLKFLILSNYSSKFINCFNIHIIKHETFSKIILIPIFVIINYFILKLFAF